MFDVYLPPATPTEVKVAQVNPNYLLVSWLPSTTVGIKYYRVEYSVTNSGTWSLAQETPYTSIQQSALASSYQYRVAAIDLFGNQSPWSSDDGTQGGFAQTTGIILNYGTDGSAILDNTVLLLGSNTYELESTSDYGAGNITDRRRITTIAGNTKQVSVSPPYIGASLKLTANTPILPIALDNNISYLGVTGGTITCWTGQNYTGTSKTFGIGNYRNDLAGLSPIGKSIRSIQVSPGASVFCSQFELARNPIIGTPWKVYNLGAATYTSGFVVNRLTDGSIVLDGNVYLAPSKTYLLQTSSNVDGAYQTIIRTVVTAAGTTNTLLTTNPSDIPIIGTAWILNELGAVVIQTLNITVSRANSLEGNPSGPAIQTLNITVSPTNSLEGNPSVPAIQTLNITVSPANSLEGN